MAVETEVVDLETAEASAVIARRRGGCSEGSDTRSEGKHTRSEGTEERQVQKKRMARNHVSMHGASTYRQCTALQEVRDLVVL